MTEWGSECRSTANRRETCLAAHSKPAFWHRSASKEHGCRQSVLGVRCLPSIIGGSCYKYRIFCSDKSMLVATTFVTTNICRYKHNFVATSILLSGQKTRFIATNTCLSRQRYACFVATKLLSRQNYVCSDKSFGRRLCVSSCGVASVNMCVGGGVCGSMCVCGVVSACVCVCVCVCVFVFWSSRAGTIAGNVKHGFLLR